MSLELDKRPVLGCLATPFIIAVIFLIGLYETLEELIFGPYTLEDYGIKRSDLETRDDYEDDDDA